MRTRVKICGITTVADALAAAEAGADAIGLVFYPNSPRAIHPDIAQEIVKKLPPFVSVTGLFVNAEPGWVETILSSVPLSLLQFHGDESEAQCLSYNKPYLKVMRMRSGVTVDAHAYPSAAGLLLDAYEPHTYGGTGHLFDWRLVPKSLNRPLILAGGLNPDNVLTAIQQVTPFAVDVSSGVEQAPGVKDHQKMAAFCRAVREA